MRTYSVRIPPQKFDTSTVKITDFTYAGEFTIKDTWLKPDLIKALQPFNVINNIPSNLITVNNTGQIVYVFERFKSVPGQQLFPIVKFNWRQPQAILRAMVVLEHHPNASSSSDFGFGTGGSPRNGAF